MVHPSENASFIFHDLFLYSCSYNPCIMQKNLFELNLLSQGSIEQDYLLKNVKKFGSDTKINFSNEQSKKQKSMVSYSSLQFILLKMSINNHLKLKISTKIVFLQ